MYLISLELWFESHELAMYSVKKEFPLLEMENIKRFAIFKFLLVEITDTVDRFFSLSFLTYKHVACIFEITRQVAA